MSLYEESFELVNYKSEIITSYFKYLLEKTNRIKMKTEGSYNFIITFIKKID